MLLLSEHVARKRAMPKLPVAAMLLLCVVGMIEGLRPLSAVGAIRALYAIEEIWYVKGLLRFSIFSSIQPFGSFRVLKKRGLSAVGRACVGWERRLSALSIGEGPRVTPLQALAKHPDAPPEDAFGLVPELDDVLATASWSPSLDLFFIDHDFKRARLNASRAHEALELANTPDQVPSYPEVLGLVEGQAMAFPTVWRFWRCFNEARSRNEESACEYFDLNGAHPIRPGKVVFSGHVFDCRRYSPLKRSLEIREGELTAYAESAVVAKIGYRKRMNVALFEIALEQGIQAIEKKRITGFYRLTDFMAGIVYDFLKAKADEVGYDGLRSIHHYLPRDPQHGLGNGKWCRALLRKHGNYFGRSTD